MKMTTGTEKLLWLACIGLFTYITGMGTVRGQTVNIDFEGLAEGTAIAAQFAPGVTFSLGDDGLGGTPQIATANTGSTIGFVGSSGDDAPAASGVNSLTPGLAGGPCPCLPSLRMDFNPPVSSVTLFILDFDANPGTRWR